MIWAQFKYQLSWLALKLKDQSNYALRDQEILKMFNVPFKNDENPLILVRWYPPNAGRIIKLNSYGISLRNPGDMGAGGVF